MKIPRNTSNKTYAKFARRRRRKKVLNQKKGRNLKKKRIFLEKCHALQRRWRRRRGEKLKWKT